MKYCYPWQVGKSKSLNHFVSLAMKEDELPHWGHMAAEVYQITGGKCHFDIFDAKGRIVRSGSSDTIEEAKTLCEKALKELGWRIVEQKYAVMV